jgi:uncharacterized protein YjiK
MKISSLAVFVASALASMPAMAVNSVDLSTYQLVGRYNLPEPTRSAAPSPDNLLTQEASGVAWNRDTNTLFIVGDGSRSITQVSLTGAYINSMNLALEFGKPQGTAFYDTEGITYVGNNQFVFVEERLRVANLVTFAAGTTLAYSDAKQVKLGTTIGNIGLEGISYDPKTGGFIAVKEKNAAQSLPGGVFQTGINFAAGTATNGSGTTANSIDLFNLNKPGGVNSAVTDLTEVFALSNVTANGSTDFDNILLMSQESGKVLKVNRNGDILGTLNIPFLTSAPFGNTSLTAPGITDTNNPLFSQELNTADKQHEGMTMDDAGNLYIVNENGGGDINYPQLWVFAPVPEPETYALILAGLALIGLRRRVAR